MTLAARIIEPCSLLAASPCTSSVVGWRAPAAANSNSARLKRIVKTGAGVTARDMLAFRLREDRRIVSDVFREAGRMSAVFTASDGGLFDFIGVEIAPRDFFADGGVSVFRLKGVFADGAVVTKRIEVYRDADEFLALEGFAHLTSLRVCA